MISRKFFIRLLIVCCCWQMLPVAAQPLAINISQREALRIGVKIWFNESAGKIDGLTAWNAGENFASMGIGHFIWYPADVSRRYQETFPALLRYIKARGIPLPWWLEKDPGYANPWINREMFQASLSSPVMLQLRQFLVETIPLQAEFMVKQLERALPSMLARVPSDERPYIRWQFARVAQTAQGVYVLVDYINFKGAGAGAKQNYREQGWGLLQVLEEMRYAPDDMDVLRQFAWAANQVLTRRVARAPAHLREDRWLAGWRARLKTYYAYS